MEIVEDVITDHEEIDADEDEITEVTEITLKLNPIQMFALRETILDPGFIEDTNDLVEKIDEGIDNSFWGNELFSGEFSGVFKSMDPDTEDDDAMSNNISALLVNLFMMYIINGAEDYIDSPVTKNVLLQELQDLEESSDSAE